MVRTKFDRRGRGALAVAVASVAVVAVVASACGGSSSKASGAPSSTASANTPASNAPAANTTPRRGFGNRTPSAAIQTSIAEGTPRPVRGTPPPAIQTAIAEGTRPAGFGGGALLGSVATALNISTQQLRTELQASGATLATVAQAHGMDRATLQQTLTTAEQQRLATQVSNGSMAQPAADAAQTQFNNNINQLMDSNGLGGFGGGGGGAPGGPPPAPAQ